MREAEMPETMISKPPRHQLTVVIMERKEPTTKRIMETKRIMDQKLTL
jgi:hypothetical protein